MEELEPIDQNLQFDFKFQVNYIQTAQTYNCKLLFNFMHTLHAKHYQYCGVIYQVDNWLDD